MNFSPSGAVRHARCPRRTDTGTESARGYGKFTAETLYSTTAEERE